MLGKLKLWEHEGTWGKLCVEQKAPQSAGLSEGDMGCTVCGQNAESGRAKVSIWMLFAAKLGKAPCSLDNSAGHLSGD